MLILLIAAILSYTVYSWYNQATVIIYAKYRMNSIIWSLILLVIAYNSGYLTNPDIYLITFIASFLLMSIVDGFGGIAENKIVVSGYFTRSLKYTDLDKITMIPLPSTKNNRVMVIFTTLKSQSFYLKFNKSVEELITIVNDRTSDKVTIEIQNIQ